VSALSATWSAMSRSYSGTPVPLNAAYLANHSLPASPTLRASSLVPVAYGVHIPRTNYTRYLSSCVPICIRPIDFFRATGLGTPMTRSNCGTDKQSNDACSQSWARTKDVSPLCAAITGVKAPLRLSEKWKKISSPAYSYHGLSRRIECASTEFTFMGLHTLLETRPPALHPTSARLSELPH